MSQLTDVSPSEVLVAVAFTAVIVVGFAFYSKVIVPAIGVVVKHRIPARTHRLEVLTTKDRAFILFSKVITALFVYHCYKFVNNRSLSRMSTSFTDTEELLSAVKWLPLHIPALFVIYDFFYTLFHWALHWPPIYPLVHKHHHRQHTPFRGNDDAINDHPFEYVTGEYNHLFSVFLLTRMVPHGQVHALTLVVFIFIGGTLASLNHTRIDLRLPFLFNVRAHDLHHRQPRVNFGQYIMFWDYIFGTYRWESRETAAPSLHQKPILKTGKQ